MTLDSHLTRLDVSFIFCRVRLEGRRRCRSRHTCPEGLGNHASRSGMVVLAPHAGHFPVFSWAPGTCLVRMPFTNGPPSPTATPCRCPTAQSKGKRLAETYHGPVLWNARPKVCGAPAMCRAITSSSLGTNISVVFIRFAPFSLLFTQRVWFASQKPQGAATMLSRGATSK